MITLPKAINAGHIRRPMKFFTKVQNKPNINVAAQDTQSTESHSEKNEQY